MKIYRLILVNRFREYIRLFKNMYIQLIGLLIIAGVALYGLWIWYIPILLDTAIINYKVFYIIILLIFILNFKKIVGKIKPQIVIKPMTLFLLDKKNMSNIFFIKYIYYILKYAAISFIFTICTCGLKFHKQYIITYMIYFVYFLIGFFLSWNLYNSRNKLFNLILKTIFVIATAISIFSFYFSTIILFNYILLICIIVYTIKYVDLDYFKYCEDITYLEKVLIAQNNNNTILLSQYSKEKIVRSIPHTKSSSRMLNNYPLMWKAFTSISRIGKIGLTIGLGMFAMTFLIYVAPFFWQFPLIEIKQARYFLLLFGVFMLFQMSVQTFVRQLDDIVEKQKDGLYIPLSLNTIIFQFSIIPILILLILTILLTILLKSQIYLSIIFFLALITYTILTLIMSAKNKRLLGKLYTILSIIILVTSNLLLL